MGAAVAYSATSREFLVAWMGNYTSTNDIFCARVSIAGALLNNPAGQPVTQVTSASPDWERDPAVAYNPDNDEFYIAYAGFVNAGGYGYAGGQRVKAGTGALVGGPQMLATASAVYVPAVTYNTLTHQYLVGWYHGAVGVYGVVLNGANASPVGSLRVLSGYYFAYDALDLDHNAPSGQYLLVTHGKNHEDAAVTILADGNAYDNGFVATNTGDVRALTAGEGNFNPRITTSTVEKKWLMVTSNKFSAVYAQFLASAGVGGTPTPPPPPPPPAPPACAVEPLPSVPTITLTGAAQSRNISVTASTAECAWTAVSSASWLTITAGGSGNGPGTTTFAVARNTSGGGRSATVKIGQGTVTVNQAAAFGNAALHDMTGDGGSDLMWHNRATGRVAVWNLVAHNVTAAYYLTPGAVHTSWRVVGTGDLNGDGYADIVWRQTGTGTLACWFLVRGAISETLYLPMNGPADASWEVRAVGDLDGDGRADIIWQNMATGELSAWFMDGVTVTSTATFNIGMPDSNWKIAGAGDLNADGKADIIWQNDVTGGIGAWLMNGGQVMGQSNLSIEKVPDTTWKVRGVGDTNGDGYADLLWQNTSSGALAIWYLIQFDVVSTRWLSISAVPDTNWHVVGPG